MSEHFKLIEPQSSGQPLLYLHGLGSPDPIAEEMRTPLEALGFSVWGLHRNDEAILASHDPQAEIVGGCIEAVDKIKNATRKKVTLVGNSLGSYLAIMVAMDNNNRVRRVLGTDAFLEPDHGFKVIEEGLLGLAAFVKSNPGHPGLTWEKEVPVRFAEQAKKGCYPCALTPAPGSQETRWMNLPKGLHTRFEAISQTTAEKLKAPTLLIWGEADGLIKSDPTTVVPQALGLEIGQADHNQWMRYPRAIQTAQSFLQGELDD